MLCIEELTSIGMQNFTCPSLALQYNVIGQSQPLSIEGLQTNYPNRGFLQKMQGIYILLPSASVLLQVSACSFSQTSRYHIVYFRQQLRPNQQCHPIFANAPFFIINKFQSVRKWIKLKRKLKKKTSQNTVPYTFSLLSPFLLFFCTPKLGVAFLNSTHEYNTKIEG